jgi:hypothetical protein
MVGLRIGSAQCPSAKNVIQTVFAALISLCTEVILSRSRMQLMLPTSQYIARSTPTDPNNDRADYRNECRYSPIGTSVVGGHYKNVNRPQQCGYARCPINRISQTRDHGSLHRMRLLKPCNQLFKIAQMQEEGEPSNELLVKTNPRDFSDCEAASPISGLGKLARSSSRPSRPHLLLRHRHIEQLSTRKTCIVADTAVL